MLYLQLLTSTHSLQRVQLLTATTTSSATTAAAAASVGVSELLCSSALPVGLGRPGCHYIVVRNCCCQGFFLKETLLNLDISPSCDIVDSDTVQWVVVERDQDQRWELAPKVWNVFWPTDRTSVIIGYHWSRWKLGNCGYLGNYSHCTFSHAACSADAGRKVLSVLTYQLSLSKKLRGQTFPDHTKTSRQNRCCTKASSDN